MTTPRVYPLFELRKKTRIAITEIIEANVLHGMFGTRRLPREDILHLRREIRASECYPKGGTKWEMIVWREEVRYALGYVIKRYRRKPKAKPLLAVNVMPHLRSWVEGRGVSFAAPVEQVEDPLTVS